MVGEYQGIYEAKEPTMQQYLQKVQPYFSKQVGAKSISITCISREDNYRAYLLSRLASFNPVDL
jgi:hypothetical protein